MNAADVLDRNCRALMDRAADVLRQAEFLLTLGPDYAGYPWLRGVHARVAHEYAVFVSRSSGYSWSRRGGVAGPPGVFVVVVRPTTCEERMEAGRVFSAAVSLVLSAPPANAGVAVFAAGLVRSAVRNFDGCLHFLPALHDALLDDAPLAALDGE